MYFSKEFLLVLYKKLSSLYSGNDIEAQGGTQFVSELKYFLATDEFKKKTSRPCDSQIKEDKDLFIKCVGTVVFLSKTNSGLLFCTKNFSNSVGESKDYDVGSNFFSVNVVRTSLHSDEPLRFPARHAELLSVAKGKIDISSTGYENISSNKDYLGNSVYKFALLFLWLNRYCNFNSKESVYLDCLKNVQQLYSSALINSLKWNTSIVKSEVEKILLAANFSEKQELLMKEDFSFMKKTLSSEETVGSPYNLILYGPPGTGKTYKMQHEYIDKFAKEDRFITTFHQSFSYEEFVEGLKPVLADKPDGDTSSDVKYKIEKGIFYKACERAAELAGFASLQDCISASDRNEKMDEAIKENKIVLLCIDEINRANVSAVFGDLISLIEPSKRIGADNEMIVQLPYSKEDFAVPANLMIVGTMNTADRSIQLLDSALRRRFRFEELLPDYNEIKNSEKAKSILKAINARIRCLLDKDHQIGHSYFIEAKNDLDIFNALKDSVIPLLEEYFYNDAQKIRQILNEKDNSETNFYITDAEAQDALEKMQNDYDDEKEFYMLNSKLETVNDDSLAQGFLSHIING